jgi:diacylglycerol kinase (ATP)
MDGKTGITVIVNPEAGRLRAPGMARRLETEFRRLGANPEFVVSGSPQAPLELARRAFDDGRRVVACGGDGLVGQIAGVAAACHGLLGILPCGSGNDFARELGIDPAKPLEAVKTALGNEVRTVDLGLVTDAQGMERPFCSIAGTGFDAAAAVWARDKPWLKGTPRYIAAVLRTLASYRPGAFRLTIDRKQVEIEAWLIAIANSRYYGGGMAVAPQADCSDGILDVVVVGPVSRLGFLRAFPRVFSGSHLSHPEVRTNRGCEIAVETIADNSSAEIIADGELVGRLPMTVKLQASALRVAASNAGRAC